MEVGVINEKGRMNKKAGLRDEEFGLGGKCEVVWGDFVLGAHLYS